MSSGENKLNFVLQKGRGVDMGRTTEEDIQFLLLGVGGVNLLKEIRRMWIKGKQNSAFCMQVI